MLTRNRIAEGLELLVIILANSPETYATKDAPAGWEPHEWAYVKGVASAEIWRLAKLVGAE